MFTPSDDQQYKFDKEDKGTEGVPAHLFTATGLLIPVFVSEHCKTFETVIKDVPRSWRDRLFSRPWQPLKSTKPKEFQELVPAIFLIDETANKKNFLSPTKYILCHPSLEAKVKQGIKDGRVVLKRGRDSMTDPHGDEG